MNKLLNSLLFKRNSKSCKLFNKNLIELLDLINKLSKKLINKKVLSNFRDVKAYLENRPSLISSCITFVVWIELEDEEEKR